MPELESNTAVVGRAPSAAWEFHVVSIHARNNDILAERLNEMGREGWQLVYVDMPVSYEYHCILQRSLL